MKLTSYREILTMAKDAVKNSLAPVRARQMKKKAEMEAIKIEENIITQEAKIQELASEYPIDFGRMIDAIDEMALMARRKGQFEEIIREMFPDD